MVLPIPKTFLLALRVTIELMLNPHGSPLCQLSKSKAASAVRRRSAAGHSMGAVASTIITVNKAICGP